MSIVGEAYREDEEEMQDRRTARVGEDWRSEETKAKLVWDMRKTIEGDLLREIKTDVALKPQTVLVDTEKKPFRRPLHILTIIITRLPLPKVLCRPIDTPSPLDPPPHLHRVRSYTARTKQLQTTPPHSARAILGP
jgi:hypothetical protein